MPSPRILFGFLGRFALLYGLLIIPWPGFNAAYARFFRGMLDEGHFLPPAQFEAFFLSMAHSQADAESLVQAAGRQARLALGA